MALDVSTLKTGKLPPVKVQGMPKLANYLTPTLPALPAQCNWSDGVVYYMDDNDKFGDCVEVGFANQVRTWTKNAAGTEASINTSQVLAPYTSMAGFNPLTGANDNGTNMGQAVKYWAQNGMAGHKIAAVAQVNPAVKDHVYYSVALYGGLYIGLALPQAAQSQVGETWALYPAGTPGTQPGSWGGHCVLVVDYDEDFLWVATWGQLQRLTWNWFHTYCDEAYVLLSHDWIEASGDAPSGLAWAALLADMAAL